MDILHKILNTESILGKFQQQKVVRLPVSEFAKKVLFLDYPNALFREVKTSKFYSYLKRA
jgi:hypothetical protein